MTVRGPAPSFAQNRVDEVGDGEEEGEEDEEDDPELVRDEARRGLI